MLLTVDLTVRTPKLWPYLSQILYLDCSKIKKHSTKTVPVWKGISKEDLIARIPKLWPLAPSSRAPEGCPKPRASLNHPMYVYDFGHLTFFHPSTNAAFESAMATVNPY